MDASPAPASLEPRSLPQLFDAIIGIERRQAWDLFVLGMLFHLPVHVFRIAGRFAGEDSAIFRANPELYVGVLWWESWNSLAITVGAIAACQLYERGATSVPGVLRALRAGGWRLFGAVLAFNVLCAGFDPSGELTSVHSLLYLLATALVGWCAPTIPVAIVERVAPWTAVARAFSLVRSNFWRVAPAIWMVWSITTIADSLSVNLAYQWTGNAAISGVLDLAVDGFLYPLRGVALAVLYFDCRVRREAYDLEVMLDAVKP